MRVRHLELSHPQGLRTLVDDHPSAVVPGRGSVDYTDNDGTKRYRSKEVQRYLRR